MTRNSRNPPPTSNLTALALISSARSRCLGCRTNWALRNRTSIHYGPAHLECTAQEERRQLRELAATPKARGTLYLGIDRDTTALVDKYGVGEVIAALARDCHERGMPVLFRRLNKIYEWLKS